MKNTVEINEEDDILRTFILFQQTARVVTKYQNALLNKKCGLSDVKFIVLMAFYYNPSASVTASEIANWTDTESHNVTTLVNRMKQEGFILAERDRRDKRFLKITVTDKGRKALKNAMPAAQAVMDRLMSSLTPGDTVLFETVLKTIRQNAYDGLEGISGSK